MADHGSMIGDRFIKLTVAPTRQIAGAKAVTTKTML
jgi:hypothetical protein